MTSVASPASATISKVAALLSAPRAKRCIELGPPVRPSLNAGCGSTRKSPWAEMGRSSPAMGRTLLHGSLSCRCPGLGDAGRRSAV